ncbi:hypothetical protein JVT61DRAFT_7102 [Boletus reticuloceps]|uniref:Uncharacterized protein n=1 Tax=Boletus reticuloceps TaxID=495285 RepID=A0A8I2YJ42_9AGAM|nr:hypothetical protein JVT61DRAFT_7102 [Boletus reticuloceps]
MPEEHVICKRISSYHIYHTILSQSTILSKCNVNVQEHRKQRDERAEALAIWKQAEVSRIERNKARRHEYQAALAAWQTEQDVAKAEGRWTSWKQPALGKLEPKLPKATFNEVVEGEGGGHDGNEELDDDEEVTGSKCGD